jgi:hypothetical protein
VQERLTSASSPEVLGSLRNEIGLLKLQIAELQSERGQLVSLIAALQETLVELRHDRHPVLTGNLPTPLFSLGGPSPAGATPQRAAEPKSRSGRNPRRLGQTTAR